MDRKNFKMILIILCIIIISGIFFINKLLYIKTMALLPVSYPVIVIDPGHGGVDPGHWSKLDIRKGYKFANSFKTIHFN